MVLLEFKDLEFIDEKERVKILFLRHFYFYIDKVTLLKIGPLKVHKHALEFDSSEKRALKFYELLDYGLNNLKNKITGKPTVYLHKGCGIPLIGNGSFGIVDRGSNLIEIKPVCGCNISCIYCSVDQDKRGVDFVIEKDYLVQELRKVVAIKKNEVEIHIGCHGEPLLYAPLSELIASVREIPNVVRVSMDTNATLITKDVADSLINSGMTRFNISINASSDENAVKIAGGPYSLKHVMNIAEYISKKNVSLTIAPVWLKGINDSDIEELVKFGKRIGADIGIQNFLGYQFGKNPVKEVPMEDFIENLKALEKKYDVKLVLKASDFSIKDDVLYPKVFDKGEVVEATLVCVGRFPGEKIGVAKDRTISVFECNKAIGSRVKIKLTRSKHNIYSGSLVR